MTEPSVRQRRARVVAFAAWAGLALLQPLWHLWLAPAAHGETGPTLLLSLIPLALPLFALRRPARAVLWAGIVALFYFSHGVAELWSVPAERLPAALETAFSLLLIGALGAGVQRRKRAPG